MEWIEKSHVAVKPVSTELKTLMRRGPGCLGRPRNSFPEPEVALLT